MLPSTLIADQDNDQKGADLILVLEYSEANKSGRSLVLGLNILGMLNLIPHEGQYESQAIGIMFFFDRQ